MSKRQLTEFDEQLSALLLFVALLRELKLELVNPTYTYVDVKVILPTPSSLCTKPRFTIYQGIPSALHWFAKDNPGVEKYITLLDNIVPYYILYGFHHWKEIAIQLEEACTEGHINQYHGWIHTGVGGEHWLKFIYNSFIHSL